jgi:hypothetical protein
MRELLDKLDPFFAAAAIALAGVTVYSQVPHPIVQLNLPALITHESSAP